MIRHISLGILSASLLLCLPSCKQSAFTPSDATASNSPAAPPEVQPLVGADICGAQTTYDSVKNAIFDQAIKQVSGDTVALNDLRRNVSVNMQYPLVKGINDQLHRTDCTGRLVLGLPPGVSSAFAGERELNADVEYSVQPAADGNGSVITSNGIGFIVQRLIAADELRAMQTLAGQGGPQLTRTYNPSFNCGRNLQNVERMICQEESLSAKDRQLSTAFKEKLANFIGTDRQILLAKQRQKLEKRANCPDVSCVNSWYDQQLVDLGQ